MLFRGITSVLINALSKLQPRGIMLMALKTTQKRRGSHVEIAPPPLHLLKELKIKSADSVFVLPRIDDWDAGRQAEILRTFLFGINLPRIRFHDLRASWATLCLSRGIESVKVMSMGGWKDLKTMMVYVRKAGINIQGMTDSLNFHDTAQNTGKILKLKQTAED